MASTRDNSPADLGTEATVIRCQLGERSAFGDLVGEWNQPLTRYMTVMSANSDLVDDLVQETWVRVIRGLSRLRDPARFSPWLFTVARRAFVDQLRRDYREPDLEPLSGQEKAPGSEPEDLIGLLNASDVLADLAPVDREAVLLHHVFGFQINEIAGIAEVPQGTVKSRLHRGRQQLKSYIEKGDNQL